MAEVVQVFTVDIVCPCQYHVLETSQQLRWLQLCRRQESGKQKDDVVDANICYWSFPISLTLLQM